VNQIGGANADALRAQTLVHNELTRKFNPDEVDVDDLATAIRRLLDSGGATVPDATMPANSALHSEPNGASHVIGPGAASPS
jgi:hypothetical protein